MADAQAGVVGVLEGKVAMLTGAARGIGRATAVSFASPVPSRYFRSWG
jgi:hypothetical protein